MRRPITSFACLHARSRTAFVAAAAAFLTVLALVVPGVLPGTTMAHAVGDPCAAPVTNKVACENTQPGTPESVWQVDTPSSTIEGFTTDASVNVGGTVGFKVKTPSTKYRIEIYRLGWYQGNGARLVATIRPSVSLPQSQPTCLSAATTGLVDCGNWAVSASWAVPATAVSGEYVADLIREDTNAENQVPFVVRDETSHSDLLFQASDTTWQAYNTWGGNSLYTGAPVGRAYKVSFNRPYDAGVGQDNSIFNAEYPMIRFLESNGYDLSYFSGVDTDRSGTLLTNHKVFLSVGHDEYWSGNQRAKVEAARAAGVNLAFFSGNEVFWKTRYEPSIDASATQYRTLVTYKETKETQPIDPQDPPTWTGTWMDPRFSPPADGGRPQNALTGQLFMVNGRRTDAMQVPAAYGKTRLWRGTSVANLPGGGVKTFPAGTLGYEWDVDADNGFAPAGLARLSETTVNLANDGSAGYLLQDYGNTYGFGPATHHLTLYKDQTSGALVFGAGTVQWAWGLDADHNYPGAAADADMRQATVNLLADMRVQPATLQAGLVAATKSTDTNGPAVAITSPAANATVTVGSPVTVSGTATDSGGGVVAGVEVSVDGGTRWHPATGLGSWTYTFTPTATGPLAIKVRAVDDSANLGATTSQPITVGSRTCPCSIFSAATPGTAATSDASAVELGVKFRADSDGSITGIRFYKGTGNTGTHTGTLWSATGQQLATGTFTGETASGWQTLIFASPVPVSANTTYVASYFAPAGHYGADSSFFAASDYSLAPLRALKNGTDGPNGVYHAATHAFPTDTFGATNYWVDVVYKDGTAGLPLSVTSTTPNAGDGSLPLTTKPTATFNIAINQSSLSFTVKNGTTTVPGAVSYDGTSRTATFTPSAQLAAGTTFTATINATSSTGTPLASPYTWSFTTGTPQPPAGTCPCSLWSDFTTPATPAANDGSAVEVGVKFRADSDGSVTGVRFYKGPGNAGTHTGTLWSATGQQLATGAFTGETATGWQTLTFATPVPVTANTVYVASYYAPAGHYAVNGGYFATAGFDYGPLHALPNSTSANGVYRYGTSGFPGDSFGAANYWVDVVYSPAPKVAPTVTATNPAANATNVSPGVRPTATFSQDIDPSTLSFSLTGPSGAVAGTASYSTTAKKATFVPAAALASNTSYTAQVTATGTNGIPMSAPFSWTFTTGTPGACPCTLWASDDTPATPAASDGSSVELGVKFSSSADGFVSGVRFYKGTGNTGTHTGSLWTSTGQLLATGTFANETASGWQTLTFDAPVPVTANTTYVASYLAPAGHYAADGAYFANAATNSPPLTALQSTVSSANGVYLYGAGGFPTDSYNSTNYWVDVVYNQTASDTLPPHVVATSPLAGAQGVSLATKPTATFSESVNPASVNMTVTGPGTTNVAGTVSYDATSRTATFTPTAQLAVNTTYNVSAKATDTAGNVMPTPFTWSFSTGQQAACPCSIWSTSTTPTVTSANDSSAVELGVRFQSDTNGKITGIRFYKGAGNTGTHTGTLWSATGQLLATGTFSGETASGWQTLTFASAVSITANTTYIASYHTDTGHYAANSGFFATAGADAPPLHALQSLAGNLNGLYNYGVTGFPSSSYNSTNYWVDVVFTP